MKALVTGGAGFIGSNLVDKLIELGHSVTVIDNESSPSSNKYYWNDKAKNYKYDICDYKTTKDLYSGIDIVFHLAAQARIQNGIDNPLQSFLCNEYGTSVVLQCSKENNIKKFIYSSSSSVYGKNNIPNVETQTEDCLNPYSVSKLNAEKICKVYSQTYEMNTVILRYFNVYGNRQSSTGKYATVIGIFMDKYKNGFSLPVTGSGNQRRDFTHVDDVVSANLLFLNINHDFKGEVFNVGKGEDYSINEVAKMFNGKVEHIEQRPGESLETLSDSSKIKLLGWNATKDLQNYIKENITL
jgi:UDP-glucose 4-epimerase